MTDKTTFWNVADLSDTDDEQPGTLQPDAPVAEASTDESGTEAQVGDLTGPGVGYDKEPLQVKDEGGVA